MKSHDNFPDGLLGLDTAPAKTRVVVAMSGGVDSSTVAALLKEVGFDVVGITLQLYDHGRAARPAGGKTCCAGQDIHDARRVADVLDIPHYVLDYERRFREAVIDDFADSYLAGETPIPCVRCNQTVKFRDLLATARDLGAAALVTGHYVRRREGMSGPELHRAADPSRDQSYFLFATTREQLAYLRFPLGDMDKSETRRHAERFRLPVAAKPDSQDICFVPNGSYARVVERLRPGAGEPGDIVDLEGRALGRHDGVIHFTIGQRRGLKLGTDVSGGAPLYVVRLEPESRRVVVGPFAALLKERLVVRDVNWLGAAPLADAAVEVQVKVRSGQPAVGARLRALGNDRAEVAFNQPQAGIAPGQACVFYDGERMLGGGWIVREERRVV